ncbi:MAG: hypothetical protein PHI87_06815 [Candidatus Methanomethylophilus sp.]|nr:hypothetical protein [Methanomethylophilus sp.]
MKNKIWFNKKGGSTIFEVVICLSLIVFIMFFPVVVFSFTHKQSLLEDVLTVGLQMVAVEGGLTDRVEDIIYENLEAKRLLPEDSSQETRDLVIVSSNTNNTSLKYRDDSNPVISLEMWYPAENEVNLLNGLNKILGASESELPFMKSEEDNKWHYHLKGYIMSEKVDY